MTTPMDLKVRVLGDASQFSGAMKQAAGSASGFKNALASAVSIGATVAYLDKITEKAERIADVSAALGITAEAMQAVDYAARHAGTSFDELRTVFATLSQKQGELLRGSKEAAAQFGALGLSADQVRGMSLEELFDAVAQAIARGSDRATSMAAAVDLIGRQAKSAMGALREIGAAGLQGTIAAAGAAGQIVDQTQLEEIARARDAVEDLKTSMDNFVVKGIGDTIKLFRETASGIKAMWNGKGFWEGYDEAQRGPQAEGPSPEDRAAAQLKASEAAATAENPKLQAIFDRLVTDMEKWSFTEEQRKSFREGELEDLRARGAAEASSLRGAGKTEEAKNVELRTQVEAMQLLDQIFTLEASIKEKADAQAQKDMARAREEADFQRGLEKVRVAAPEAADQLARIGGYQGAQTDSAENTRRRQLQIQEKIEEHTRRMAEQDGGVTP